MMRNKQYTLEKKRFTLLELLVVIAIIAILAFWQPCYCRR